MWLCLRQLHTEAQSMCTCHDATSSRLCLQATCTANACRSAALRSAPCWETAQGQHTTRPPQARKNKTGAASNIDTCMQCILRYSSACCFAAAYYFMCLAQANAPASPATLKAHVRPRCCATASKTRAHSHSPPLPRHVAAHHSLLAAPPRLPLPAACAGSANPQPCRRRWRAVTALPLPPPPARCCRRHRLRSQTAATAGSAPRASSPGAA